MQLASRTTAARWLEIVNALDRQRGVKQISKAHSLPSPHIERVGIFIDGANLYAASRTLGLEVDYKALLTYFQQRPTSSVPTTTRRSSRRRSTHRSDLWSIGSATTATRR